MRPARLALVPLVLLISACANDKQMHFVAGAAAARVVDDYTTVPLSGCVASLGIGLAKEAFDSRFGGTVDARDVLATGAGCMVSYEF